jgi:hypothetical protein
MPPGGSDTGPAAVEPFSLPFLGTRWVDRGPGYWVRRGLLTMGGLLFLAVVAALGTAFYLGFASLFPARARVVLHVVEAVAAAAALIAGWVAQRRKNDVAVTPEEVLAARSRASRAGARAYGNQGLAVLLSPVLPALAAYVLGGLLAGVLVRETPRELGARLDYERRVAAASRGAERKAHRANERRAPRNGPTWR